MRIRDVLLNVEVEGKGDPLLLLHGFTGSIQTWKPFRHEWRKHMQLVMVDIIGHGFSDAPADPDRYTMEEAARDICIILDRLEIARVHVFGYSLGGRLALSMAAMFPQRVRSLHLESASPGLVGPKERMERRKQDERLAQKIEADGVPAFVNDWEQIPLFATQKKLPAQTRLALREQRLQNRSHGLANSLRGMGTGRQPSWWGKLPRIDIPVNLTVGEWDPKFCALADQMLKQFPHATKKVVPRAGHTVHLEQPAYVQKRVCEFVREVCTVFSSEHS